MQTNDISNDIDDSQPWRIVVIVILAVLMTASLLSLAVFTAKAVKRAHSNTPPVVRSRKSKCLVWTATTLLALTSVLMWILLSAFTAVGMVGGDFCQDPDGEVLDMAEDNELIQFYVVSASAPLSNCTYLRSIICVQHVGDVGTDHDAFFCKHFVVSPVLRQSVEVMGTDHEAFLRGFGGLM